MTTPYNEGRRGSVCHSIKAEPSSHSTAQSLSIVSTALVNVVSGGPSGRRATSRPIVWYKEFRSCASIRFIPSGSVAVGDDQETKGTIVVHSLYCLGDNGLRSGDTPSASVATQKGIERFRDVGVSSVGHSHQDTSPLVFPSHQSELGADHSYRRGDRAAELFRRARKRGREPLRGDERYGQRGIGWG